MAGQPGAYRVSIDTSRLRVLVERTRGPFGSPPIRAALGQGIRKWGLLVQTRAVFNVTGHPVVFNGQAFVVRVRTGTLRGAIELQWPYQSEMQARVFVNGAAMNPGEIPGLSKRPTPVSKYALAIELGHDEIDLKKTMKGKVVPFFGTRQERIRGPYAAAQLKPVDEQQTGFGSGYQSEALNRKLAAKNKGPMIFEKKGGNAAYAGAKRGASSYFISFRRVGDTGWVIPKAKPRPFMRAAAEGTVEQGRRMLVKVVVDALVAK